MTAARHALAGAVLILLATTGCSSGAGGAEQTPSPSPAEDQVTIAAPPTVDSTEVELSVTGPIGSQVDVYAYSSDWSLSAPTCTSTDDPIRSLDISESPTTVKVSVERPGVWWWVAASSSVDGGVTTQCGAVSTLARAKPDVALAGPRPIDGLNGYSTDIPVGKPFRFYVITDTPAPKPLSGGAWPVEAVWVGPFSSAPEARSAPCESGQVALRAKGRAAPDKPAALSLTPTRPGVYRVVASASESRWNVADTTGCDNSTPYLVVR